MTLLTDGEFEVMECLWGLDRRATMVELAAWGAEHGKSCHKHYLVRPHLRKILKKQYAKKLGGEVPTYRATITREEYLTKRRELFIRYWGEEIFSIIRYEAASQVPKELKKR